MKQLFFIILVLPLLAACGNNTEDAVPTQLSGPSLVMFYTDN